MFRACRDSFTPDRKNCIHGVKIYTRTLRILASTHLLHSLIKITGHVFSTKTTCHVIPTCHAIPSWWLIMHKNLSCVKTLFLASAHHPTQKQTKSPSIGIKFVLFATNRRLEALWQSNKLLCSIKWKTRAAAAWKTTEFNDVKETVDEQRWSRNTKTPVVTRLLTRSTTNPKTATINSDFWHDELGDPMTVQRPDHGEPMHRKLEKWGGNISQGSFLDQKSLTRMTTLLVSANACKDETLKRNWFYFIPWGSQLFNLNIPQYTYDAPILTDG